MGFPDLPLELRLDILGRWQRYARRGYVLRSTQKLVDAFAARTSIALTGHPLSVRILQGCGLANYIAMVKSIIPFDGAAAIFAVSTSTGGRYHVMRMTTIPGMSGESLNLRPHPVEPISVLCWEIPPQDPMSGPYLFRVKVV